MSAEAEEMENAVYYDNLMAVVVHLLSTSLLR